MIYKPEDIQRIRVWLNKNDEWKLEDTQNDIEIWRNVRHGRRISLPLNGEDEDLVQVAEKSVKTIALVKGILHEEAYRQIILSGITLNDVIPFINEIHEGLIFQWSGDMGFGEYMVYREKDEEQIKPWSGDSEYMDGEDKRYLRELMRQYVDGLTVIS